MAVTASPALLLASGVLLYAAAFVRVPPDRWATEASEMLGSDGERLGWQFLTHLWLVALLVAFTQYANVRHLLTTHTGLMPPWRDYLTVVVISATAYLLRWLWLATLRRVLSDRIALRAIERWRRARHRVDGNGR